MGKEESASSKRGERSSSFPPPPPHKKKKGMYRRGAAFPLSLPSFFLLYGESSRVRWRTGEIPLSPIRRIKGEGGGVQLVSRQELFSPPFPFFFFSILLSQQLHAHPYELKKMRSRRSRSILPLPGVDRGEGALPPLFLSTPPFSPPSFISIPGTLAREQGRTERGCESSGSSVRTNVRFSLPSSSPSSFPFSLPPFPRRR